MKLNRYNPNIYKSRTAWQKLGFDIKPEYYGRPAAVIERKGNVFKAYTQEQVAPSWDRSIPPTSAVPSSYPAQKSDVTHKEAKMLK